MVRSFRTAVAVLLISLMTVGPAGAYYGFECGCSAPASTACEPVVVECECAACESEVYEAAPVVESPCGCETTAEVTGAQQMEAVEAKPQPAPITPMTPTEAAPATSDPKPAPGPETAPPVTTENRTTQPSRSVSPPPEDLFEAPPSTPPAIAPAEEAAPANEPPAEAPPADSTNDIFGSSATESTLPAEEPVAEEPRADEPPAEQPEEGTPPAEETEDPLEDFFNAAPLPSALQIAGGLESEVHRTWIDNSGKYRCQARLVRVTSQDVLLSKADGTLKTVPLRRLSDEDLKFVHGQVVAKQALMARDSTGDRLAGR